MSRSLLTAVACTLALAVAGCASLPASVERTPSSAFADTANTRLGRSLAPAIAANPGKTGVYVLRSGRDAFAARVLLAHTAERSLDVQYYIWHHDVTGGLLAEALWDAAERGVRVRLLLDDQNTRGVDDAIAALDAHPLIEVRLFNPFANRSVRLGDYAGDFSRVNRRMHNKSFTVDNQISVVGGRNVGDEYFGATSGVEFADLDVAVAGAVVREVSAEFDAYWNSESAYPAGSVIRPSHVAPAEEVRAAWKKLHAQPEARSYLDALRELPMLQQLLAGTLPLEWVNARVVADSPAKVLNPPDRRDLHMLPKLEAALGKPTTELDLVSPYFVPTKEGTAALVSLVQRGVKVRVLTNSLAATDVSPVHAGYSKYRERLLQGGVMLYELKPAAGAERKKEHGETGRQRMGSSSGASLHAKTFAVDRSRIYVGSFNLDPRSARLNTEMGVVLDSANLATSLSQEIDEAIPEDTYVVQLQSDGQGMEWVERTGAGEVRHATEPGTGFLKRLWIGFLSILPIEWLL